MCPRNEELCPNYHPKDSIFGGMWGWGKFGIPQGEVFNGWVGWTSYRKLWLLLSNWGFPDVSGKCSPSSTNMYNCAMTIVLDALSNRMHIQLRDKVDVCVDEIGKSLLKFRIWDSTDRSKGNCCKNSIGFHPRKEMFCKFPLEPVLGGQKPDRSEADWKRLKFQGMWCIETIGMSLSPKRPKWNIYYVYTYIHVHIHIHIHIYILYLYRYRYRYTYTNKIQAKYLDKSWWIQ